MTEHHLVPIHSLDSHSVYSQQALLVRDALQAKGTETPLLQSSLDYDSRYTQIKQAMQQIMQALNLDLQDDSLHNTPDRIAKMYLGELFAGLDYRNFPDVSLIENKMGAGEIVAVKDISLTSTCEHHFVTIDGLAQVAYIPKDSIIGLSKINRIVRFFAQRPQVQERLTQQILVALQTLLATDDVAVRLSATHYCVKARGVRDGSAYTMTCAHGGAFLHDPLMRAEFKSLCG